MATTDVHADVPLPQHGRLLLFFFDGSYDGFASIVGTWDPPSLAGARLLHLVDDATLHVRAAPPGVEVWPERPLTVRQLVIAPDPEQLRRAVGMDDDEWAGHPLGQREFTRAVESLAPSSPRHQIGGWPSSVQQPVEDEVAAALISGEASGDARAVSQEVQRWTLLLQVDSDVQVSWGDAGALYWLVTRDDLERGDLSRTSFTWQSG